MHLNATPRCPPPPAPPPTNTNSTAQPGLPLAIVIVTRPPYDYAKYELRPLHLLVQSLASNSPTLAREAPLMLYATDATEAALLTAPAPSWPTKILFRHFQAAVGADVDVHRLPEKIKCIAPVDFRGVGDIVRYSAVFRSLKRLYGGRAALDELPVRHVLVTDADGFAWKDVSASAIVAQARAIWYSDNRGAAGAGPAERPPLVDTLARARLFCSLHPFAATLRSPAWDEHAPRMAVGRDWAAWEVASAELLPVPDADLADDPLVLLEARRLSQAVTGCSPITCCSRPPGGQGAAIRVQAAIGIPTLHTHAGGDLPLAPLGARGVLARAAAGGGKPNPKRNPDPNPKRNPNPADRRWRG